MGIHGIEVLSDTSEADLDDPIFAHFIDRGDSPKSAAAILTEAMVNGTPLTALCGYTWVPSRDPQKYPVCEKCKEIFEFAADFRNVL